MATHIALELRLFVLQLQASEHKEEARFPFRLIWPIRYRLICIGVA